MSGYRHGYYSKGATSSQRRLYKIWERMKSRCNNPNARSYKYYGGRGINVCKEWENFVPFAKWAEANGYSDDLTIDRIDVNGDYEPSNCRWVTMKVQQNNKRNNVHIVIDGVDHTASEWSDISGVSASKILYRNAFSSDKYSNKDMVFCDDIRDVGSTRLDILGERKSILEWSRTSGVTPSCIRHRLNDNWPNYDAVFTPMTDIKTIEIDGESHTILEWARIKSLTPKTIYDRINAGISEVDAVMLPRGYFSTGIKNGRKAFSEEEINKICQMYTDGASIKEIANCLDRTDASIRSKLRRIAKQHEIPEEMPFD